MSCPYLYKNLAGGACEERWHVSFVVNEFTWYKNVLYDFSEDLVSCRG